MWHMLNYFCEFDRKGMRERERERERVCKRESVCVREREDSVRCTEVYC